VTTDFGGHPERLLWYAAGRLDRAESADIEAHVGLCRRCSGELAALRSMIRSVRSQERLDHVSTVDLVAYHDGAPCAANGGDEAIRAHLRECRGCAEDLDAVRTAARRERDAERPNGSAPRIGRVRRVVLAGGLAAGAACLALALPALSHRTTAPPTRAPREPVVFAPPLRLAGGERALAGPGPWKVRILLPFRAGAAAYRMRIRATGETGWLVDRLVGAPDDRGEIRVDLPALPGPGAYVLSMDPEGSPGGERHEYAFDVKSR